MFPKKRRHAVGNVKKQKKQNDLPIIEILDQVKSWTKTNVKIKECLEKM